MDDIITLLDMLEELMEYIDKDTELCYPNTSKGAYLQRLRKAVKKEIANMRL